MKELLAGGMVTGYLVAALFFLRFWSRTRDALFGFFAAAFTILALQRLALTLTNESAEYTTAFYGARLVAFLLIIAGIWNKNREND